MIHTKQQIENVVRQLFKDIDRKYRENSKMHIEFENDLKVPASKNVIKNGWGVGVQVDDDQWDKTEGANILIDIDDDTLEIVSYLDCSMGRPVPMKALKDNSGKYYLEVIQE